MVNYVSSHSILEFINLLETTIDEQLIAQQIFNEGDSIRKLDESEIEKLKALLGSDAKYAPAGLYIELILFTKSYFHQCPKYDKLTVFDGYNIGENDQEVPIKIDITTKTEEPPVQY